MDITIKDKTITLKRSFRSLIAYEKATGAAFSPHTVSDMILYFFCVIISSDEDIDLDFDTFIDWIDEEPARLTDFTAWLTEQEEKESRFSKKKVTRKKKVMQ